MMSDSTTVLVFNNGLTLNHVRSECDTMFRIEIVVRAGSADETAQERGFAHLMEHLMSFFVSDNHPFPIENQVMIAPSKIALFGRNPIKKAVSATM